MPPVEKRVSKKLQNHIDELNGMRAEFTKAERIWGKGREIVQKIYHQGLQDGHTEREIAKLILKNCKFLSQTSLYSFIPQEAKAITRPKKIPNLESAAAEQPALELVSRDLGKDAAIEVIRESRSVIEVESESDTRRPNTAETTPEAGPAAMSPAPDIIKEKDDRLAAQAIEIKNLHAALADITGNMPAVKELKHELELKEDENKQLKQIIEKQKDKLFTSASEISKSRKKFLMNKKFIGSIFAINSNNGRAKDFDVEFLVEGDRVVMVGPQAVNVIMQEIVSKH